MLAKLSLSGEAGSVGVRPASVRLHVETKADALQATVIDVVPTGGNWIVELSVDGDKFFAITPEPPQAKQGQKVGLSVAWQHLHIFDAAGSRLDVSVTQGQH